MSSSSVPRPPHPPSARKMENRRVEFLLKPKFTNTLPDIPFEGKFMPCPFVPISRFCEYKDSTLEREYKHNVICDEDIGLNVDLIDLVKYDDDREELPFDEKDQILLDEEGTSKIDIKRSAQHTRLVPWMRKTEYISTEYNRFGLSADRQETKLGYNLKKNQQVDDMYRDRQSQIDAINKTFEDVKKPITQHYSKKGVHAVEESYMFPDFENWKTLLAYVQFDSESINVNIPEGLRKTAAEMSLIRGMQFDDEQIACLFTPTVETIQKRMEDHEAGRLYDEDEKYEFGMNREYTWKLDSASQKRDHDNFIIHWKDGKVNYNEIESNVKMIRRRKMYLSKKSTLMVQFRDFNEKEMEEMNTRFENLFKPPQKIVEEEEEAAEKEEESGSGSGSGSDGSDSDGSSEKEAEKKKKVVKKQVASSSSSSSSSAEDDDDSSDEDKKKTTKKAASKDDSSDEEEEDGSDSD